MAFFELGPGPRSLFEPGTWDLGYLEGGLFILPSLDRVPADQTFSAGTVVGVVREGGRGSATGI